MKNTEDDILKEFQRLKIGNSKMFGYGDLNFLESLYLIDKEVGNAWQSSSEKTSFNVKVPRQQYPREVTIKIPNQLGEIPTESQHIYAVSFLCYDREEDPLINFSLHVLHFLMFES